MQDDNSYIELIEKGVALLQDNNRLAALACFEKAFAIGKSPELLSYLSYCIAAERGQLYEALNLCNDALSQEPGNPVHYLNLGRIYLHAGKKEEALLTLRKGLSFGENQTIKSILEKIGTRGKPVFPFLHRNSFLNKYIGLLLHRLNLR
jgi:tetratricopeptide (TPR) repeat protein